MLPRSKKNVSKWLILGSSPEWDISSGSVKAIQSSLSSFCRVMALPMARQSCNTLHCDLNKGVENGNESYPLATAKAMT